MSMIQPLLTAALAMAPAQNDLQSLVRADAWINSAPLSAASLKGKVVVVEFWTYTCINWLRTLSYTRAWADRYKDKGLVVIGVHSPEFSFEKDQENVRRAVKQLNVTYPVAVDSDHEIWAAFDNNYWPALYFVDATGRIRDHHYGEGNYEESEKIIQGLLKEAGKIVGNELVKVEPRGFEIQADWGNLKSGENYLGAGRTENFVSPGGTGSGQRRAFAAPAELRRNQWAIVGEWTIGREAIQLNQAKGRIVYRFHARDVHLVMGPANRGASIRFRVLIDGKPPGAAHGADVDEQGFGTVSEQRLYQLIRQSMPIDDRTFEIEFLDAGVEAYAFTFG